MPPEAMAPELLAICQKMLKEDKSISVAVLKAKAPKHIHSERHYQCRSVL